MSSPILNIVVPLYNEELVFNKLVNRLTTLLDNSQKSIEVIMVDDGSKDSTANLMLDLSMKDARFHSIILSRNFGHQTALTAGLSYVNASEGVMIIDGDLQDPPELIHTFYKEFQKGHDVIYAIRKKRKEGPLKIILYSTFYRMLRKISYIDIPLDTGDFSFISRRVVDQMNDMPEESRYLRGMRSWIGFSQIGIEYERSERADGDSKYPFSKLLKLALNGIFNFSEFPVKAITNSGFLVVFFSIIYICYTLFQKFVFNSVPEGFTTLVVLISLFGGTQLIAIGVIGEYIMRIFFQVKGRPLFVVKNSVIGKIKKN
jgi:polyisoprenyl-phosphate glycosyltransferase